jgi:SAM-dependent methyltransferase
MDVNDFFELLLFELKDNPDLWSYYKFLKSGNVAEFNFRKNYFIQRLSYINSQVSISGAQIWDCGCGYGTTAIFLTLNGHTVYGNTLEFYIDQIPKRLAYWKEIGNLDNLTINYANIFDLKLKNQYDYIIAQDTLHHLEPIDEALALIYSALKDEGKLIVIEENGTNVFGRFKNYLKRGNKRIIEIYDEKLGKTFLLGNENTRTLDKWKVLLSKKGLHLQENSIDYTRLFLPIFYRFFSGNQLIAYEKTGWHNNKLLKKYFYFGVNFVAEKKG